MSQAINPNAENSERFIPVAEPLLNGNELAYVTDCVTSSWISSLGKYIPRFEQEFARFCGTKHGVATSNGTTALHLALVVLGIGQGDQVIVPSLTFIASANAVYYTGAEPVLAESEPRTWNLDPIDVARKITPRTKAIMPVHLYGHPVDMDAINAIAREHNLIVLEDAAEAHGAEYKGQRVGRLGRIATFSFYGNKIITTGEGGMLTTDNDELAEKARWLRDHGMSPTERYWHPIIGYNYRITNIQAALGVAQMERIDEFIARKREIAALYSRLLGDVSGITLPPEESWAKSVYWMYSILVGDEFGISRDALMAHLKSCGIDSRPFFHPIHTMPPYNKGESLPVAERLARQGINLPSALTLTDKDIQRIANAIREAKR
ncbi:MAG: DegT/DnrJ/EryC1/StrS family aminotransferase [Chloroflexi bacterium]|nr:DegT/DnrJ/EryC1/StrS family aminotransferase [Chloroflexota bacterium]